jgi:hypothetical protein
MKNCEWPDMNVALASALRHQEFEGLVPADRTLLAVAQVREAVGKTASA